MENRSDPAMALPLRRCYLQSGKVKLTATQKAPPIDCVRLTSSHCGPPGSAGKRRGESGPRADSRAQIRHLEISGSPKEWWGSRPLCPGCPGGPAGAWVKAGRFQASLPPHSLSQDLTQPQKRSLLMEGNTRGHTGPWDQHILPYVNSSNRAFKMHRYRSQPRQLINGLLFCLEICHGLIGAKSLQSCLTLYNSMDWGLPGSSVRGILQARILEWRKKKEYWSGLPFPPPGDLLDPGIEPASPASPALAGGFFTTPQDRLPWRSLHLCLPTPAAWLPHPQLLPTCSLGYSHPTTPSVSLVSWWDLTALSDEMLPVMCTDPGARLFPQT